ncbi:MAG: hypothetical protein ABI601_07015 [bacterium]
MQSIPWTGTRAVLLIHGVGNAKVGDYVDLVGQIERVLGPASAESVVYTFYYDQVNDWFADKQQAGLLVGSFLQSMRSLLATVQLDVSDPVSLGNSIADLVGDVVWPVLLADARNAVKSTLIEQLFQIVEDAGTAGVPPRQMELSVVAHSMGCFHLYETLQTIAEDTSLGLGPVSGGLQLANVIYMASPVQLIRSVMERIAVLVPQKESIRSLSKPLAIPVQSSVEESRPLARHTAAITGNLDPVGGHFFRAEPAWAFMNMAGQDTIIDQQQLASVNGSEALDLTEVLHTALRDRSAPVITPNNPHSWSEYVRRHEADLRTWLVPA